MFTLFGHSSNWMVLHKVGNIQQLGGLRWSHAESIIQPDAEQPTDDSQLNFSFVKSASNLLTLSIRVMNYVTITEFAYQDILILHNINNKRKRKLNSHTSQLQPGLDTFFEFSECS